MEESGLQDQTVASTRLEDLQKFYPFMQNLFYLIFSKSNDCRRAVKSYFGTYKQVASNKKI